MRHPQNWTIYANGIGGWYAWNGRGNERIELVRFGSFAEAVKEFERLVGPYYSSRVGEDKNRGPPHFG